MIDDSTPDLSARDMREPCPQCGWTAGLVETRNGLDAVSCAVCGRFCYNVPACANRSVGNGPHESEKSRT